MPDPQLVAALRQHLLNRTFGAVRFWRFAAMRPHDQTYELVSTHTDGDRLDLVFVHASREGLAGVLSVEAPEGLTLSERGLTIARARSVWLDALRADEAGDQYSLRSPSGTGAFPKSNEPALTIEF